MNIFIDSQALSWFKQEVEVQSGEFIRFFVRYGGSSPLHDSFSLGLTKEEPIEVGAKQEYDGVTFFIEQKDLWFFDEHDLHVHYNEQLDEPEYTYVKPE